MKIKLLFCLFLFSCQPNTSTIVGTWYLESVLSLSDGAVAEGFKSPTTLIFDENKVLTQIVYRVSKDTNKRVTNWHVSGNELIMFNDQFSDTAKILKLNDSVLVFRTGTTTKGMEFKFRSGR